MNQPTFGDLQESLRDRTGFRHLADYEKLCSSFLALLQREKPTRIISPSQAHYVFYQYAQAQGHAISRPLNTQLFFESRDELAAAFARFVTFLGDLKRHQQAIAGGK